MQHSTLRTLRQRLTARIEHVIDWRIDNRIPPERLKRLTETHERLTQDSRRAGERIDELTGQLAELHRQLDELRSKAEWSTNELERLAPHVAAQESQLESLRQKLATPVRARDGELDEARSLLDEVRREHAQIRTRLTAMSKYEERIARLEHEAAPPEDQQ